MAVREGQGRRMETSFSGSRTSLQHDSCVWISTCFVSPWRFLTLSPPGQLVGFGPQDISHPSDLMWEDVGHLPHHGIYPPGSYTPCFVVLCEPCSFWRWNLAAIIRKTYSTPKNASRYLGAFLKTTANWAPNFRWTLGKVPLLSLTSCSERDVIAPPRTTYLPLR